MTDLPAAEEPQTPVLARRSGDALVQRFKDPGALATSFEAMLHETKKRRRFEAFCRLAAELCFAYWSYKYGHPKALLDKDRERYIMKRLEENRGDVSELLYALDGGLKDDWVMGTARGARHRNDGLLYLFANRERVEQLAENCRGYRDDKPHPMALKHLGGIDVAALVA